MNHCDKEFDFHSVGSFSELEYNHQWAIDSTKTKELMMFVNTWYKLARKEYDNLLGNEFWEAQAESVRKYQEMTTSAMKAQNIEGVAILWSGIYYHDRDSPCYELELLRAAEFGGIKVFQHTLYAFMNYTSINGTEPISYKELKEKCTDKKVQECVDRLNPIIINGELYPIFGDGDRLMLIEEEDKEYLEKYDLYKKLSVC